MMHHPNMHHQPMSGHPPQHMGGHQGMPGHHQMPPHQMHRENRVPLGPGGAHGQALGGLGAVPVHHAQRAPHPIRPMHHPQPQHHAVPPVRHTTHQQMKPLRRPYVGGAYGPGAAGVLPPYVPPPLHPPAPPPPVVTAASNPTPAPVTTVPSNGKSEKSEPKAEEAAPRDEARTPLSANSKEKTPMCLVNELARYNKIKHQYRLTSESGPAHKKVFTVTLRLGDAEEYTAEGSSIKRAQHAAAGAALGGTRLPAPPARAPPHAPLAARHAGTVMPTVELNALAMKLCQPAVYSVVAGRARGSVRGGLGGLGPLGGPLGGGLVYRVRVGVGGRAWLGEGSTPQAARHDAAARALRDLRPAPAHAHSAPSSHSAHSAPPPATQEDTDTVADTNGDVLNSEVKSPVSLVHELALKRNLDVMFAVKSERGPPHMRVFVTTCSVGDIETEGEGNGKKVSKRRAAERMVEEMRRRWPPALLRARPMLDKRRPPPIKKKPRNLIKEGGAEGAGGAAGGADNPISRLAVARHAARARSPQYVVLEERGAPRRREFLVQCCAPPHAATGLGPNKKTAKRRAAHNVLLAMEMSSKTEGATTINTNTTTDTSITTNGDVKKNNNTTDTKRKDGEAAVGGASSEVRQPVPGVLLMDYHTRSGHPHQPNGVSETSATGGAGGNSPGAKDQLMYLSQLLGFTVQFSDFPKRNHGEYLSLVSLSTEPPVMCHGGGASTAHSHEQCARAALRALALMGLDAPAPNQTVAGTGTKTSAVSNGIAE